MRHGNLAILNLPSDFPISLACMGGIQFPPRTFQKVQSLQSIRVCFGLPETLGQSALRASGEVALSKWLMLRIGGNCLIATIILLTAHIFCLIGFLLVLVNVTQRLLASHPGLGVSGIR